MNKIFVVSDTHFGHENMIYFCGRPSNFEELIFRNLSRLPPDSILIHLGDICVGKDKENHEKYIKPLKMRKWLIKGNHDSKSDNWYLNNGWDFVCETFSNEFYGKEVLFSHHPHPDIGFDINFFGHFHNNLPRLLKGEYISDFEKERNKEDLANLTPKHYLLSLEETNYEAVDLESWILKT
ncbi:MAG: hypothetical protein KGJ89_05505 [Patescibacteria group bacterium]|nr:hypothetical protein [Patescibacteria group bacterium]